MVEEKKQKFDKKSFFYILIIILVCSAFIFLGFNLKSKKEQMQINNNPLIVSSAKSINELSNYDNVSDLTGTTWFFNDPIYQDPFPDFTFYINFNSNNNSYTSISMSVSGNLLYNNTIVYRYQSIPGLRAAPGWQNSNYRTISIFGGTDVTNGNLIYWLYENATLEQSQPTQLITPIITKSAYNQLSWSSIQNASGYAIYKDNELYDTTINTLYTVTALGSYQVMALGDNESYLDSDLSNTISITSSQLNVPIISINNDLISWSNIQYANSYEIYLDNELIDIIYTNSYTITQNGNYQVKAVSNSVFFTDSNFSNTLYVNYQYAKVIFYAKDNITELISIENWLIGKSIYNFTNDFYNYNNLLNLLLSDFGYTMNDYSLGGLRLIFNDNIFFENSFFDSNFIISSDINIYSYFYYQYNQNKLYTDYTVSASDSSTLFTNLGQNLISDYSLTTINVNIDLFSGYVTSVITYDSLLDDFVIGDNFSIYTDSFNNNYYFDCVVTQNNSNYIYTNILYRFDIVSQSFVIPTMDYNMFVIFDSNTNKYQFIGALNNVLINYSPTNFNSIFKYNQNMNFYYCNYFGFTFNILNYDTNFNNYFRYFIKDSSSYTYEIDYNISSLVSGDLYKISDFNYILINSNNFNNFIYDSSYINFSFMPLLNSNNLTTLYNNISSCIAALENLSIKFSFGNPILYYYDTTDKTDSPTGTGIIPTDSNGLYKTDFAWYDVTAYIYNFFIYLIFDMPIVSNITKLIYQIIQLILFVINQIILLFSGVTNNIFLVSILGFLLLKFVIDLLVKH